VIQHLQISPWLIDVIVIVIFNIDEEEVVLFVVDFVTKN
jgi:hypothetical protein